MGPTVMLSAAKPLLCLCEIGQSRSLASLGMTWDISLGCEAVPWRFLSEAGERWKQLPDGSFVSGRG